MSRIFQPRERVSRNFADDIVGRFRSGYQVNKRPAALTEWRVTSGDPEVLGAVRGLLGGDEIQEWEAKGEDNLEVFTDVASVNILLENEDAIEARMVIWARGQKRIVTCEGDVYETEGGPYVCETGEFTTKREHEESDHVCEPVIRIRFRLADDPDLGLFEFQTGSWSMATVIGQEIYALQKALDKSEGEPVKATLSLEQVEYESGGKKRKFTKPVLTVK